MEDQCFAFMSHSARDLERRSATEQRSVQLGVRRVFSLALKASLSFTLLLSFLGPSYSYVFLRFVYGREWADHSSASILLSAYFVYLVAMSVNGICEATFNGTLGGPEFQRYGKFTLLLSLVYLSLSAFLSRWLGPVGLIVANALNMIIRVSYCLRQLSRSGFVDLTNFSQIRPKKWSLATLIMGSLMSSVSGHKLAVALTSSYTSLKTQLCWGVIHLLVGGCSVIIYAICIWVTDSKFVEDVRRIVSPRTRSSSGS